MVPTNDDDECSFLMFVFVIFVRILCADSNFFERFSYRTIGKIDKKIVRLVRSIGLMRDRFYQTSFHFNVYFLNVILKKKTILISGRSINVRFGDVVNAEFVVNMFKR
jgi:hypothetical protein